MTRATEYRITRGNAFDLSYVAILAWNDDEAGIGWTKDPAEALTFDQLERDDLLEILERRNGDETFGWETVTFKENRH